MAKKGPSASAGSGDPLKYFCLVFAILLGVIGFVLFKLNKQRNAFRTNMAYADKLLTGKGLAKPREGDPPSKIHDLAIEVERMVLGHSQAVGNTSGGRQGTISATAIQKAALEAGITSTPAGGNEDAKRNELKGYMLRARTFTIPGTRLSNFVPFIQNIESKGLYTVYRLNWQLESKKKNSEKPFNRISRSTTVRVGFRQPYSPKRRRNRR